jgi:ABC-2 type transport system ATP-binding protein
MTDPLIEAVGLTRRFDSFVAAEDVSFTVGPGEVVGLLGANGAGKTTTIRMLLGLLAPTSGQAHLLGGSPTQQNRAELGYVPQGLGLYQELTAAENVAFSAAAYGTPPAPLTGALAGLKHRLVRDLPLGLRRQLAFVCALQHQPRALVLDEPTSGVEPLARAHLWDTIRAKADAGVGVLVTTHYMTEARQCDRLLLMSRGRLVAAGSERDIVGDTQVVQVRAESWQQVFELLDAADLPVTLAGTAVRVTGVGPADVESLLAASGLAATVEPVPATIDERMVVLARS